MHIKEINQPVVNVVWYGPILPRFKDIRELLYAESHLFQIPLQFRPKFPLE